MKLFARINEVALNDDNEESMVIEFGHEDPQIKRHKFCISDPYPRYYGVYNGMMVGFDDEICVRQALPIMVSQPYVAFSEDFLFVWAPNNWMPNLNDPPTYKIPYKDILDATRKGNWYLIDLEKDVATVKTCAQQYATA